jgi:hypothetical protein
MSTVMDWANKYRCWCPDDGDEESGTEVDAFDAHQAAEQYGAHIWGSSADCPKEIRVYVRPRGSVIATYIVRARQEVSFSATFMGILDK